MSNCVSVTINHMEGQNSPPVFLVMRSTTIMVNETKVPYLSVGDAARRLGVQPRIVTMLFYQQKLRDDLCPIIGGRRVIPETYLSMIELVLKRAGRIVADPQGGGR